MNIRNLSITPKYVLSAAEGDRISMYTRGEVKQVIRDKSHQNFHQGFYAGNMYYTSKNEGCPQGYPKERS